MPHSRRRRIAGRHELPGDDLQDNLVKNGGAIEKEALPLAELQEYGQSQCRAPLETDLPALRGSLSASGVPCNQLGESGTGSGTSQECCSPARGFLSQETSLPAAEDVQP